MAWDSVVCPGDSKPANTDGNGVLGEQTQDQYEGERNRACRSLTPPPAPHSLCTRKQHGSNFSECINYGEEECFATKTCCTDVFDTPRTSSCARTGHMLVQGVRINATRASHTRIGRRQPGTASAPSVHEPYKRRTRRPRANNHKGPRKKKHKEAEISRQPGLRQNQMTQRR